MSEPQSPRFVVRRLDPADERRRRWLMAMALGVVLLFGVLAGYWLARQSSPAEVSASPDAALPAMNVAPDADREALAQQVVNLKRSEQMAKIAADSLRHTLADREEEISALRADLAFYSRLVGSGEQQSGLVLHSVHVTPIQGSNAYNLSLVLTQSANRGAENQGKVRLALEGVDKGKLVLLDGADIGDPGSNGELPYRFKYFEQLHATVLLPAGFIPNRLRVVVKPDGGNESQHNVTWADALKPLERDNVQQ
ncbi:MAG TPA: DUF6776 family protein [Rhodanobacteraceae bacterium]|nr:DUF6776 family protein [Rhodanobacteraceae bacterium]